MTTHDRTKPIPPPLTLTDRIRALTATVTQTCGSAVHRAGIHPDTITIAGLGLVLVASGVIAAGYLQAGAVLLLLGLPLDALDGAVARAMQRRDSFGALLDSTLDRYADAFIFAGLGYHFAVQDRFDLLLLTLAALIGSYSVSYVRARAEGLGVPVKIGWFSRLERVGIVLVMLLVPGLLTVGLVVLAVGTNLTGLQRLWFVYKTLAFNQATQQRED
ncbi:MAG: CDP-alcohol phosphatidyltransferase family protein [Armatimonadetes bacterium]|nr:CDP-alcohol phosphatidyltransferase family protein [Anaerolineae bacterium]